MPVCTSTGKQPKSPEQTSRLCCRITWMTTVHWLYIETANTSVVHCCYSIYIILTGEFMAAAISVHLFSSPLCCGKNGRTLHSTIPPVSPTLFFPPSKRFADILVPPPESPPCLLFVYFSASCSKVECTHRLLFAKDEQMKPSQAIWSAIGSSWTKSGWKH